MRHLRYMALFIIAFAFRSGGVAADPLPPNSISGGHRGPVWKSDFYTAEAEARRLGLPMVVHFSAEWCGPCQQMEREVLHSPALYRQLEGRFIAVKIDSDRNPELVRRFGIDSLPSDLFLDTNGTVLSRSSAYQDQQSYLSRIAHVDARVAQSRKMQIAGNAMPKDSHQASVGAESGGPELQRQPQGLDPIMPHEAGRPTGPDPRSVPRAGTPTKRPTWALGLRGFSPVTLSKSRQWVRGDAHFASEYKGIVYHMTSAAELAEFEANPNQYAPQLQGCDPVVFEEQGRAIIGDTRFGVFYNGELYFFVNPETRARFKAAPHRYTRTKHVLNIDKIEPTEML